MFCYVRVYTILISLQEINGEDTCSIGYCFTSLMICKSPSFGVRLRVEFMYFARIHLKLSQYDVGDMELKQFYKGEVQAELDFLLRLVFGLKHGAHRTKPDASFKIF